MQTHSDVYSGQNFQHWSTISQVEEIEDFAIANYLDRSKSTLEGGTGGGRLLFELQRRGFRKLAGYDLVPSLIDAARAKPDAELIDFRVLDAANPDFADESFEQILYMQQLLNFVPEAEARASALRHAHRMLAPGGIFIVSLLILEGRMISPFYRPYLEWLRILRQLRGHSRSLQYQPWLRLGGKRHWGALVDKGPYVYWYTRDEAYKSLTSHGFDVTAIGSPRDASLHHFHDNYEDFAATKPQGVAYFVCRKQSC